MKLTLSQILLTAIVGYTIATGGTLASAVVAAALVAYEVFRYNNENKQKEADIASFEAAFKKYRDSIDARMDKQKEGFDSKLGTLDSRVSTFVAMRKM